MFRYPSNFYAKEKIDNMRNGVAVAVAAVVGAYVTIIAGVGWACWFGRTVHSATTNELAAIIAVYISNMALPFIGCVPGGILAARLATQRRRRICAALGGLVAWTILVFGGSAFLAETSWVFAKSSLAFTQLCGSVAGGLVGGMIYTRIWVNHTSKG